MYGRDQHNLVKQLSSSWKKPPCTKSLLSVPACLYFHKWQTVGQSDFIILILIYSSKLLSSTVFPSVDHISWSSTWEETVQYDWREMDTNHTRDFVAQKKGLGWLWVQSKVLEGFKQRSDVISEILHKTIRFHLVRGKERKKQREKYNEKW